MGACSMLGRRGQSEEGRDAVPGGVRGSDICHPRLIREAVRSTGDRVRVVAMSAAEE